MEEMWSLPNANSLFLVQGYVVNINVNCNIWFEYFNTFYESDGGGSHATNCFYRRVLCMLMVAQTKR